MPTRIPNTREPDACFSTPCGICPAFPSDRCTTSTQISILIDIDVEAEQAALTESRLVVWLHPICWYSVPALLKQWFDVVLTRGWAYGKGGTALKGKDCLWVATTGGTPDAYTESGAHQRPFDAFVAPIEQTAKFCGMQWLPPLQLHGAHVVSEAELASHAAEFRARLIAWQQRESEREDVG